MNITLWILQVLLALAFAAHGVMMLAPPPDIAVLMNALLPRWFQIFIGGSEVLAAIGLTLPGVTRIMLVMVSATVLHAWRHEYGSAATTFVLLLIATFVAYNRWQKHAIAPRGR